MTDNTERREPGYGWVPYDKLKRQQLITTCIALEGMRDRAIARAEEAERKIAAAKAEYTDPDSATDMFAALSTPAQPQEQGHTYVRGLGSGHPDDDRCECGRPRSWSGHEPAEQAQEEEWEYRVRVTDGTLAPVRFDSIEDANDIAKRWRNGSVERARKQVWERVEGAGSDRG